ncbi:Hypothetical predicted protein [Cloeon dipterum]|uniref:Cytochrome P450 n=1 Tax=Cloeon dipterum TaxID=197152 RepID=A0A8S1C6C6_9INSE|nr:Hypothetical predicted protein [Cloeon dipterum]
MGLLLEDSCLADTALLLLTTIYLLYWYGTCTFDYWKKRGVPEIKKKVPFLGSTADAVLFKKQMNLCILDAYRELEGHRFGGLYAMRTPALIVRDPELIKHIMVKDFSSFTDNSMHISEKNDPMFAFNIFAMKGDKWKYARSKLAPAFTTGKIRNTFPLILEVCNDLKSHFSSKIESKDNDFEAHELAKNFTTDVVGSCAFGIKCNSLSEPDNQFRKMGKEIMSPSTLWRQIEIALIFFLPKIAELLRVKFIAKYIEEFFQDLILKAFAYREEHPEFKRNDFINLLMQLKKLGEVEMDEIDRKNQTNDISLTASDRGKIEFSDVVLTAQAVGFFLDGFETSSMALAFALHELAMNPRIQENLRDELRKSFDPTDGCINYDNIRGCAYLDNILHETLRIYTPVGALARECTKRYTIPDSDVQIDIGDIINIPIYGLHQDPKYFPNPEVFNPDRFTEEAKKTRPAFTYLPFGEGPRQCIGFRFAQAQVKAAIATIVLNFLLEPSEKTEHPVVFDERNFFPHAKNGLHLKISPL